MANKKYTFPDGITRITPKELDKAFCNYDIVEIPGSVAEVRTRMNYDDPRTPILKNLILHEGTSILSATIGKNATYNIPSTLINITCDGVTPKVVCLNNMFQNGNLGDCSQTEYLQADTKADIRFNEFKSLKHYVYLGASIKNWKYSPFEYVPQGCVIHVENKRMAMSVLKKCDVFKHYVVVDADEWKDFPADKLALTMEEYDPESRILQEQKEMRISDEQKRLEAEKRKQDEERKKQKQHKVEEMTSLVIRPILEPILGGWNGNNAFFRPNVCEVLAEEDRATGESKITISAVIAKDWWRSGWDKSIEVTAKMLASEVPAKIGILAEHIQKVQDFIENNRGLIEYYGIQMGISKCNSPHCPAPGISLPYFDTIIVGNINIATIEKDVKKINDFVYQLTELTKQGKKAFPKGFAVSPR